MDVEYTLNRPQREPTRLIDYAKELNEDQYQAVTAPPGAILVIAGAGSGKTRTLTYRVAYLVENGVEPENILLLTFTNKAAKEMLHRVTNLLPHDISNLWGGTFHHVCNRLLRRHAELIGYGRDYTISDRDDAKDCLESAMQDLGLDPKDKERPRADVLLDIFSYAANTAQSIEKVVTENYPYFIVESQLIEQLAVAYQIKKKEQNVMDYDDLLIQTLNLLNLNDGIRERYQMQFQHLLVDEYQDTNKIQSALIDLLAGFHKQIMAVGDDAQSIYSWRGADFQNIISFPERYPGTQLVKIEMNYRSTPEILELANQTIAHNTQQFAKTLRSGRRAGEQMKPALVCLDNSNMQADFICQRIMELHEEGVDLNEIAILYRSHFHAMELQFELTRRAIPFQITSGLRFFEQAHVKDTCAFLKLAVNPKDEVAFKRIAGLLPGIGAKTAHKLWGEFSAGKPLEGMKVPAKSVEAWKQFAALREQILLVENQRTADQIRLVLDGFYEDYMKAKFSNYTARKDDLGQLQVFSQQFERTEDFLAELSLQTNLEANEDAKKGEEGPQIRLSTVHQAKGLEWKVVFVMMLCDGLFPSSKAVENGAGEEEERRLFYVAVTRAKDELYLTHPEWRTGSNANSFWQKQSRFIDELPSETYVRWRIK
ncbi:MAG: ATP-dependent helicase [Verrucomicrobiota bacterium]